MTCLRRPRACRIIAFASFAVALGVIAPAAAQSVSVRQPWIRGTIAGQKATGAYMEISSTAFARLVAAESPAAGAVEIHNMKMEAGVMKMAAVTGIDVLPGKPVHLAPGGYHLMLLELKRPLKAGERVPLRLSFELANGRRESLRLDAEVRDLAGKPPHAH
ncbi:MAG: copper chaperone PCu(A)C [Burkholderiales bacterium]|nr:copper chaperone PCu(A)C [Burkholderiales bacterium]